MEYRKREYPVSRESAVEQFMMLLDAYDIDMCAYEDFGENGKEAFELIDAQYENFVLNIRRGLLSVVEEDGKIVIKQHLKNQLSGKNGSVVDEITYYPLTNSHLIAADKYSRKNEPTLRCFAFMGAVSKLGSDFFIKMPIGSDSKAMDSVYSFFTIID